MRSCLRPLAKPVQAYPGKPVPAARLARALLICISAVSVVPAPCGVPVPFTALRRTGNRLGIGGAEQRPMPVGAISPDKGPAGGASNIGG